MLGWVQVGGKTPVGLEERVGSGKVELQGEGGARMGTLSHSPEDMGVRTGPATRVEGWA